MDDRCYRTKLGLLSEWWCAVTPTSPDNYGLPGTVTETAYIPTAGLTLKQWGRSFQVLGQLSFSISWWIGDAITYGEEHYGEQAYQYIEDVGLSRQTLLNIAWVAKAIPRGDRRETLSYSHHAELAALGKEDREHWLDRAETGETLPNGEVKRWSCTRLRQELRALNPKKNDHGGPPAGGSAIARAELTAAPDALTDGTGHESARGMTALGGMSSAPRGATAAGGNPPSESYTDLEKELGEVIRMAATEYGPSPPGDLEEGCRFVARAALKWVDANMPLTVVQYPLARALDGATPPKKKTRTPHPIRDTSPITAVRNGYGGAYTLRYGTAPTWNAQVNGMIGRFLQRVPVHDAPAIAAHYVQSNFEAYVRSGHAISLMLRDAEKLATEWKTGNNITSKGARELDRKQASADTWGAVIERSEG